MEHTFPSESFQRENRTTFSEVPFIPENFQWNVPKTCVPFTSQPEFPEFLGKWKTPLMIYRRPRKGRRKQLLRKQMFPRLRPQETLVGEANVPPFAAPGNTCWGSKCSPVCGPRKHLLRKQMFPRLRPQETLVGEAKVFLNRPFYSCS